MKKVLLILVLALFTGSINGQKLSVRWSEKIEYDDFKDGYFDEIIGENKHYIYVRLKTSNSKLAKRKIKIIALDKKTLKKSKSASIVGFDENKSEKNKFKDLNFYKEIIYDDVIYIFWYLNEKDKEELYVQSFSKDLKPLKSIHKIYEVKKDKKADKIATLFVKGNPKIGKVLIGSELNGYEGDHVKFEYKLMDDNFNFISSNQISLDFLKVKKAVRNIFFSNQDEGLSSSYSLGDDGDIHVYTSVSYSSKEIKELKSNGEYDEAPRDIFSKIDPISGDLTIRPLKFKDKNIFNIHVIDKDGKFLVYGFYSDKNKDPRGNSINGIFYIELNENYELENAKFNDLNEEFLDKLFEGNEQDRFENRSSCLFWKKKKAPVEKADREKLKSSYRIRKSFVTSNGEVFLFCTIKKNWSTEHCSTNQDGLRTCNTTYYSLHKNITTFKLSSEGELIFGTNHPRSIQYSSGSSSVWYINDFNVVKSEGGFHAIYGDSYNRSERKEMNETDAFDYVFIDEKDGSFTKMTYDVNAPDTPKKNRKKVNPTTISTLNGVFYVNYTKRKIKPLGYVCCLFMIYSNSPLFSKGQGMIGEIKPID